MTREELLLLGDLNYAEALREQTRGCSGTIVEEDGIVVTLAPHPHPVINNAIRVDARMDAAMCFDRIVNFYVPRGHGYTIVLRAAADDSDLVRAAGSEELVELLTPPAMVVEEPLEEREAPADCQLRWVEDKKRAADYRSVVAEAWQTYGVPAEATNALFAREDGLLLPHLHAVVAYLEGAPVGAAYALRSHGIAGIYWVSTVPAARGRGIGEACTRAVTNRCFAEGAGAVSLQASPMGEPIYRRMGFEEIGRYRLVAAFPPE